MDKYGGFDLYILDCIMPGIDGIETGAFNYLLKPVDKDKFFQTMDKAFKAYSQRRNEIVSAKALLVCSSKVRHPARAFRKRLQGALSLLQE